MLAYVFYTQALGYFFAALMTLLVLGASHKKIMTMDTSAQYNCGTVCIGALDRAWRIIIGIGIVIGLIAVWLRRIIPESPLYTAEVLGRPDEAREDFTDLIDDDSLMTTAGMAENGHAHRRSVVSETMSPTGQVHQRGSIDNPSYFIRDGAVAPDDLGITAQTTFGTSRTIRRKSVPTSSAQAVAHELPVPPGHSSSNVPSNAPSTAYPLPPQLSTLQARDEERQRLSFGSRSRNYWKSFHQYFITDKNWPNLALVCAAWFLFDISYYILSGTGATSIASRIFYEYPLWSGLTAPADNKPPIPPEKLNVYDSVFYPAWQVIVLVNAGSLIGGIGMIWTVEFHSLRTLQLRGFVLLTVLFAATGGVFLGLSTNHSSFTAAGILLYILVCMAFELLNFSTFMLPVELFPTRHRAFSHGLAAASGKLGALLFQFYSSFSGFTHNGNWYNSHTVGTWWLGGTVLSFIPFMLLGAVVSYYIPETRADGNRYAGVQRLEDVVALVDRAPLQPTGHGGLQTRIESDPVRKSGWSWFGRRQKTDSTGNEEPRVQEPLMDEGETKTRPDRSGSTTSNP
jgi:MFS transporter, PHS family, inorganic phosphate transporter